MAKEFINESSSNAAGDGDVPLPPLKYNTPSLRDLFATAPYLHSESAETLMDVLDQTATSMGRTDHLSQEQKETLVAYLLTL